MRYKLQIAIILLFIVTSCTHQSKIDIPVIQANTGNKAKISQLFPNSEIIPLETNSSGLMGLSFFRIEPFQDRIYILNQLSSHQNILCFDNDGHHLFTLDKKGEGPGEYTYLGDFFIDRKKEQLILDSENNRFYYFDKDGQFLFVKQSDDDYFSRQICSYKDSVYFVFNDQSVLPKEYDLLTVDPETMNIVKKSPAGNLLSGILYSRLSIHDDRVLCYEATDTIFDITDVIDRKAEYIVDFGSSHHKSILYLLRNSKTLSDKELMNQTLAFFVETKLNLISTFFENDRFLAIGYIENGDHSSFEHINTKHSFLLYDKNNRQTYNSNNIEFDILNMKNMGDINILGQYDNALYAIYIPQWSDENKKRMLNSPFLSERLKTYIPHGDDEDNPMLVILK
jgi:hypothetical protein